MWASMACTADYNNWMYVRVHVPCVVCERHYRFSIILHPPAPVSESVSHVSRGPYRLVMALQEAPG